MKEILSLILLLLISQSAFAQTKIDEYDRRNLFDDDEFARLGNFAIALNNNPKDKGYLIVHKSENVGTGKFLRRFFGVKRVLTDFMGIKPERFQIIAGKERKEMLTEFWLVSDGEKVPDFPTLSLEAKLNEPITKKSLFDYECIGCDPAVIIDFFIFNEGLEYFAEALKANPNSNALIIVGKNEFISKTRKERKDLIEEISEVLTKKNHISKNRIKIQFTKSDFAKLYLIPTNGEKSSVNLNENKNVRSNKTK